ncbi:MAG TPA: ATP-binding protein [Nocardioidaceae bacterium]|nr:ATP-binding protein [Nocardioidaceae bacterium]
MPLNLKALELEPEPESVKEARAWVRSVLDRLDRDDIIDTAELCVSELVTNAILHGTPPISVRVRGTREHPRVEVRDASSRPPSVNIDMADEDHLLVTFGRGLALVALHSKAWGAELVPDGKVVWFEPADSPRLDGDLTGDVFDLEQTVEERLEAMEELGAPVRIRLLGLPVAPWARFRQRFFELGRELRLLSLAHGHDYPVANELTEVFLQTEQERRLIKGREKLDEAIEQELERVDLDLLVPKTMPDTMEQLRTTLERADQFCREQRLLVLAASPQQKRLVDWWCNEFMRQARGEEPIPWTGSTAVEEDPYPL